MSKNIPAKAIGPPGRPALPPEAEHEIMAALGANMRISSGEIVAILKKHGVSGDMDALQDSYRKRLGQRLMSSIRDESGKREVLARGSEYIVIECCADRQDLKAIRYRIRSQMNGLDVSARKVQGRIHVLERMGFQNLLAPGRDVTARVPNHSLSQPKRGDTR